MFLALFSIEKAKPKGRPYKLSDGNGLHLLVQPNGSRLWRLRYRFGGKQNMIGLGAFPVVSLAAARSKRDEARRQIAEGMDPSRQRQLEKIASATAARNTFGTIAREYLNRLRESGRTETTIDKNRWLLEDLASVLAKRPITEITPAEILLILKRIEKTGRRDTARRLRGVLGAVFRFAIVTLRAKDDPTYALRGALLAPQVTHRAAITDEQQLGALLRSIDDYDGWPTLRAALQLLALTMTRPGDVRHMRRSEVIFAKALWRIPAERMKMRRPHDVPLSRQALNVIREVWDLSNGRDALIFPSIRSAVKPLSENAFNAALRRMGYTKDEVTAHGFRSSASTILNERGFDKDVIEAALAHLDQDGVRRAYNRAAYLPERIRLMQAWADLIDEFEVEARQFAAKG